MIDRMGVSLQIAAMAMGIAMTIAIPIGIVSAVNEDTWLDYGARLFSITGLSIPDFWIATVLLLVLSLYVGWLPEFGWYAPWEDPWRNFQAHHQAAVRGGLWAHDSRPHLHGDYCSVD